MGENRNIKNIVMRIVQVVIVLFGLGGGISGFLAVRQPGGIPVIDPEAIGAQSYNVPIYMEQGGAKLVVGSGGKLEVQSGATVDVQSGVDTSYDNMVVSAPTAIATATPVFVVDSLGVSKLVEVRDAATPVFSILNAGAVDSDTTGAISLDADTASNFNVSGASADLTIESEAGKLILKGDEANANAVTIDANDAVTTGLAITVGSVSGMTVNGGLLDIGGGTCGVADGDNDVCIAGVLEVDDEFELDGALDADSTANIAGLLTLQAGITMSDGDAVVADKLRHTAQGAITVTMNGYITPTGTYQPLTSGGTVNTVNIATGTAGDLVVFINTAATSIIFTDTGTLMLSGNITLQQYDVLVLWSDGTNWLEVSNTNN